MSLPLLPAAHPPLDAVSVRPDLDGRPWFVPIASIPSTSPTSATPAVFVDREGGRWLLRVTVDLDRPTWAPSGAQPFPIGAITLRLDSDVLGSEPVTFDRVTEVPGPGPALHRYAAVAEIDRDRIAAVLREDQSARFTVAARVHHAVPAPHTPHGTTFEVPTPELTGVPLLRALHEDPSFGATPEASPNPVPAPPEVPVHRETDVVVSGEDGLRAWFPPGVRANRPIYALVDSAFGVDPASAWRFSPAGAWKYSGIPGRYYLLPTEYRLGFDDSRDLPAMDVVLVEVTGSAAPAYRVRVRFTVLPWPDPAEVEALRSLIASVEGIVFPELVVGGDDGATFQPSALLAELGGQVVGTPPGESGAGFPVDSRGFEYVVEGSVEYYTLLTSLLAPADRPAPGLSGRVSCTLRGGPEDPAPQVRDVPVVLRLDQQVADVLTVRLAEDSGSAVVSSRTQGSVLVRGMSARLLVLDPDSRQPTDAIPTTCEPDSFRVESAEVSVALTPARPVGPEVVTIAAAYREITLSPDPAVVLERVHELSASGPVHSWGGRALLPARARRAACGRAGRACPGSATPSPRR
ncbi:hypothetical protein BH18ACT7_BH18ACT7_02460 [soil metagenome]